MPETIQFPSRFGLNSGQSTARRDGIAKVTGTAVFAADNHPDGLLHAVCAPATIARGRVTSLDTAAALAHPGVVEVITPDNRPIAMVLAETIEAATEGVRLLNPRYEVLPARIGLDGNTPYKVEVGAFGRPGETAYGDLEAKHSAAKLSVDVTYETPEHYHNAMETHAIVAQWAGDHVTLDMPNQAIVASCAMFAHYFGIPPENVLIRSPYLGGGFGSKAIINGPQILTIMAARMTGRPVKMMLPRDQMFGPTGHRGATRQRVRIGIDGAGEMTVLDHESLATTSTFDDFVETSAADMGQGAWTVLAQIAADSLGLALDRIEFRSGSSDLPDGGIAGGSGHTATAGSALHAAGTDAIRRLADIATTDRDSPLFGAGYAGVAGRDGRLYVRNDASRSESYATIIARAGGIGVEGTGSGFRNPEDAQRYAMYAHGAVFAEVKVDPELFQMRVTRLVGAFAAGRIINPKLAESQLLGGMIWGISFALHEEAKYDRRTGRIMNADLASYHIPVNADVTGLEVITVHEDDPYVNSLGIKGVGEIGITGTVGAIGNAIWHATGSRIRRFPIRIQDLLGNRP